MRRADDFKDLFSTGRRARVDGVTVFVRERADDEPARLGLAAVGPGGAVVRNRIRRRLRAAFEHCESRAGIDVAVRGTNETTGSDFQDLVDSLREALNAAGGGPR